MNKSPINPTKSGTEKFGTLIIWATLIPAFFFFVGSLEMMSTGKEDGFSIFLMACGFSLSSLITGLILIGLGGLRQELACIRQILNEETGRVSIVDPIGEKATDHNTLEIESD